MSIGDLRRTRRAGAAHTAPLPTAIASAVAFAGAIIGTAIAVATGSTHHTLLALIPLGLVTAVVAALTSRPGAMATAWICWCLDSGFVIGREAQLTFGPPAQVAALVLVATGLLAGLAGHLYRLRAEANAEREAVVAQPIQSWNDRPDTFS